MLVVLVAYFLEGWCAGDWVAKEVAYVVGVNICAQNQHQMKHRPLKYIQGGRPSRPRCTFGWLVHSCNFLPS